MDSRKKYSTLGFLLIEAVLVISAAFLEFAVAGYMAFALLLIAMAMFIGLLRLLAQYARKNPKCAKILKTVLTSLAYLGAAGLICIDIPIIMAAHTDKTPNAPYIIVLGAQVVGYNPSYRLNDRLVAAKAYLEEYPQSIAVVSGGKGKDEEISEADCMRLWLVKNGISADRILTETKSASTEENIKNSLEVIRENGGDPTGSVAICSSEYHLYRAKYYASEMGAKPLGIAASSTNRLQMVSSSIREAFGIVRMWIM